MINKNKTGYDRRACHGKSCLVLGDNCVVIDLNVIREWDKGLVDIRKGNCGGCLKVEFDIGKGKG